MSNQDQERDQEQDQDLHHAQLMQTCLMEYLREL